MENSDLIMRALKSHCLALEQEIAALRSDVEHEAARANEKHAELERIASLLWADPTERDWDTCAASEPIIAELQRRGVMNGGFEVKHEDDVTRPSRIAASAKPTIDTAELRAVFMNCLYRDAELGDKRATPPDAIIVEGITAKFAFHPVRLESHRDTSVAEDAKREFETKPRPQLGPQSAIANSPLSGSMRLGRDGGMVFYLAFADRSRGTGQRQN